MGEQIGRGTTQGLWDYACELYRREGSEQLLLGLQDDQGADVLLLIAACWVGLRGIDLDVGEWRDVVVWHTPWREQVIEPLRRVRRHLLGHTGRSSLYEQVKAAELAAEKEQLVRLESYLGQRGQVSTGQGVLQALRACCAGQGIDAGKGMERRLDSLAQLA